MIIRRQIAMIATLTLLAVGAARAGLHAAAPPTAAQMEAVKKCAAEQGVDLPAPPSGDRHPPGAANNVPPDGGDRAGGRPAKLTDAQKTVLDACFRNNGLTSPPPPQGHPMHEDDED